MKKISIILATILVSISVSHGMGVDYAPYKAYPVNEPSYHHGSKDIPCIKKKHNPGYKNEGYGYEVNDKYESRYLKEDYGNRDIDGYGNRDRDGYGNRDRDGYGNRDIDVYGNRDRDGYGNRDRDGYGNRDRDGYGNRDRDGYGNRDREDYGHGDRDGYGNRDRDGYENRDRDGYDRRYKKEDYGHGDRAGYGYGDRAGYGYGDNDMKDGYEHRDIYGYDGKENYDDGYRRGGYGHEDRYEVDSYRGDGYGSYQTVPYNYAPAPYDDKYRLKKEYPLNKKGDAKSYGYDSYQVGENYDIKVRDVDTRQLKESERDARKKVQGLRHSLWETLMHDLKSVRGEARQIKPIIKIDYQKEGYDSHYPRY